MKKLSILSKKARESFKYQNSYSNSQLIYAKSKKKFNYYQYQTRQLFTGILQMISGKNKYFTGTPHFISENTRKFASDMTNNTKVQKKYRKWSKISLKIYSLFLISFSSYSTL